MRKLVEMVLNINCNSTLPTTAFVKVKTLTASSPLFESQMYKIMMTAAENTKARNLFALIP